MLAQLKMHSFVITLRDAHLILAGAVLQLRVRNPLETKTFLPLREKEKSGVDIHSGVFLSTGHEGSQAKKMIAKVPRLGKPRIDRSITVVTTGVWNYCSVRSQGDQV